MGDSRVARLRKKLREEHCDALLVSSLPNIRYLSGFTGSNALCVVTRRDAYFLTDARYTLQSRDEVRGFRRSIAPAGLLESAARMQLLKGCKRVAFESHVVTVAQRRNFTGLFPGISFMALAELVEELALVKDRREIDAISAAVSISDRVYREILPRLKPGVRERDIAAEISFLHRRYGAEKDAFDPIVASGTRGALPHARATSKRIRTGELVILDFGCLVDGYGSDVTRTVAVGRASRKANEIYRIVLEAQRQAIAAAMPGVAARDLDAVARRMISSEGYGKYFQHSLGHGLGLHPHERPRISALSDEVLMPGMVITIEPGIYIPGFGGVRIEDDVVLSGDGCRVLNRAPKDFTIV